MPPPGWPSIPVEREDYRRLGWLEAEIGAAGIVRRLVWRIKSGDRSRVLEMAGGDIAAITCSRSSTRARNGDGVSISVVRDTARYIGMAVANLVDDRRSEHRGARRPHRGRRRSLLAAVARRSPAPSAEDAWPNR